jgi:hypothetical protein
VWIPAARILCASASGGQTETTEVVGIIVKCEVIIKERGEAFLNYGWDASPTFDNNLILHFIIEGPLFQTAPGGYLPRDPQTHRFLRETHIETEPACCTYLNFIGSFTRPA